MRSQLAVFAAAALIAACGASSANPSGDDDDDLDFSPEDDAIFGDSPPPEGPAFAEEPAEPQGRPPPATGPAQVTIQVKLGTELAPSAQLTIADDAGRSAGQGRAGQTFTLRPGIYTITARVTDTDAIVTAPVEGTEQIEVAPGREQEYTVSVPAAQVKLDVRRNGRPLANPLVTLFREAGGPQVHQFRAGDRYITITPGRYEADVRTGNQQIRVRGLTFMEGARQTIPVNIQ